MKRFLTLLTIPFLALLFTGTMWGQATTRYVPGSYTTIQAAITAATAGDIVEVTDGSTYTENLTIDKKLTLRSTATHGNATGAPVVNGLITITADEVTIQKMKLTNPLGPNAIHSSGYSNLTIESNLITDVGTGNSSNVHSIAITSSGSTAISGIVIKDNKFYDIGNSTGGGSSSAVAVGFSGAEFEVTGLLVEDNNISNINANTSNKGAYGILLNVGANNTTANRGKVTAPIIRGNSISDLEGLWAHAIGLECDTPGALVEDNDISDVTDYKTPSDAIAVFIEDNKISTSTVTIKYNNFATTVAIGVDRVNSDVTVDAKFNWWGHASGPENQSTNSTASGTKVGDVVAYSPWLSAVTGTTPMTWGTNSSIQAAIDAASAGDIVMVKAGTYSEKVIIDKASLTLQSISGAANTTIIGAELEFHANNIVLDGFTVDNDGGSNAAIAGRSSDGCIIKNNIIKNSARGVRGDWYGSPTNLTVIDNVITGVARGVTNTEGMTNLVVTGNTFDNISANAVSLGTGVTNVALSNNTFSNVAGRHIANYDATLTYADGTTLFDIHTTYQDNTFDKAVIVDDVDGTKQQAIYSTISQAVDEAAIGATVKVAAGTYTESTLKISTNDITLKSISGAEVTTIDADGSTNAIEIGDYNKTGTHPTGVTIEGFTVKNWAERGIGQRNGSGTIHVKDNTVVGPLSGSTVRGGIILSGGNGSTVTGNTITVPEFGTVGWSSGAILLMGTVNANVEDNTISGHPVTADYGIAVIGAPEWLSVDPNWEEASGNTIKNNDITKCGYGIGIGGNAKSTTVEYNTIYENEVGVDVSPGYDGEPGSVTVQYNNITDNDIGVRRSPNVADANYTVSAINNWWGDISGPYNATSNPAGMGDPVTDKVVFDPWTKQAQSNGFVLTQTSFDFDTNNDYTTDVTLDFSTLPPGGGHVFVYRAGTLPSPFPPLPDGALTSIFLEITSSMTNYTFEVTVTLTQLPVDFDANTVVMYYNSTTEQWMPIAGVFAGTAGTFSFSTNHFTPFAFVDGTTTAADYHNTASTAYDLFITGDPAVTGDNVIYPNNTWDLPATLPTGYPSPGPANDWGYTGDQAVSVFVVPSLAAEFGGSTIDVQWTDGVLGSAAAVYDNNSIYFGNHGNVAYASGETLGSSNSIRLDAALANENFGPNTATAGQLPYNALSTGDYIAKLNFELLRPGSSQIDIIGADLRHFETGASPKYVWSQANNASIKAHLGDVANSTDETSGDGAVDLDDLNIWGIAYWSGVPGGPGMGAYKVKFDIGPTSTNYVDGLPAVDGKIDFEDLMIFAINYGLSANNNLPRTAPTPERLQIAVSEHSETAGITTVTLGVTEHPVDLRGLSLQLAGDFGTLIEAEYAGSRQDVTVFHMQNDGSLLVDLAVLGGAKGLERSGDLLTLRFAGKADITEVRGLARDSRNDDIAVGRTRMPIADGVTLQHNYPNPFNPVTNIAYSVPEASVVRIDVFNALGAHVATLTDGMVDAGMHTVQWNGRDLSGRVMPSGMYIYRLSTGETMLQRTMILNK